jgi:hypothetical protein
MTGVSEIVGNEILFTNATCLPRWTASDRFFSLKGRMVWEEVGKQNMPEAT